MNAQWDLTEFYTNIKDPKIDEDIEKVGKLISEFNKKYKGKVNTPNITPEKLGEILEEYIEIAKQSYPYENYAGLLFARNSTDSAIGALHQRINEIDSKYSADLLWFSLERKQWSEETALKMINSPALSKYKHFLEFERVLIPHILSEKEERILNLFSPVGAGAFVRLYEETQSNTEIELEIDGEIKKLSLSEINKLVSFHEDRVVRQRATEVVAKKFEANKLPYTFILNTLLLDSKIGDEVRNFKYPQESTFLEYEVKPETVSNMVKTVETGYPVVERFYKAKAKILKLEKLHEWDRYSAIYPSAKKEFSWEETKELVLTAFERFDKRFAEIAKEFFDRGWIDADVTKGKQAGAFCSYGIPTEHPFILTNFTGELNDVLTLAHELGHGIHAYLSREQSIFEFHSSTAIAEIASIFAESLVFDLLQEKINSEEIKVNLLAEKLQGSFATVFRQTAFYLFESDIHTHRRERGELTTGEFSNHYQNRLQKMFGKSLELSEWHKYMWMPISHFYHYNFYVFTYAFGELLTVALYAKYKMEGKKFVSKYLEALSMGGSKNPYEITKAMGVDINEENFWKNGLELLDGYVTEFEKLASQP